MAKRSDSKAEETQRVRGGQTRTDRKEATRHKILMAALRLVESGRSPNDLGLREVAREAGMAAPSLYNHFSDMDELGLALVDDCLARLRGVVRSVRHQMDASNLEKVLQDLLQLFLQYVNDYETILRLLIQQWFNPNVEYRKTIRREMSIMRQDFAESMGQSASIKSISSGNFDIESDAVFSLLITYILNVIDMDKSKRNERIKILEKQVLMIMFGGQVLGR